MNLTGALFCFAIVAIAVMGVASADDVTGSNAAPEAVPTSSRNDLLNRRLIDYYERTPACSAASVHSVRTLGERTVVTLSVESGTLRALSNMHTLDRDDWLALHCPPEYPWFRADTETILSLDVLVETPVGHRHVVDCRAYFEQRHSASEETTAAALARLQRRLEQLVGEQGTR